MQADVFVEVGPGYGFQSAHLPVHLAHVGQIQRIAVVEVAELDDEGRVFGSDRDIRRNGIVVFRVPQIGQQRYGKIGRPIGEGTEAGIRIGELADAVHQYVVVNLRVRGQIGQIENGRVIAGHIGHDRHRDLRSDQQRIGGILHLDRAGRNGAHKDAGAARRDGADERAVREALVARGHVQDQQLVGGDAGILRDAAIRPIDGDIRL